VCVVATLGFLASVVTSESEHRNATREVLLGALMVFPLVVPDLFFGQWRKRVATLMDLVTLASAIAGFSGSALSTSSTHMEGDAVAAAFPNWLAYLQPSPS
jgi:hypothetical protein